MADDTGTTATATAETTDAGKAETKVETKSDTKATTDATTADTKTAEAAGTTAVADAKAGDTKTDTKETKKETKAVEYDLKLPDKSGLHASIIKRTAATARELGLSPDVAQKVLDFVQQEASSHAEKSTARAVEEALKAHQPGGAEWEKQQTAWKTEALADPVLGKTEQERRAVIDKGKAVLKRYTDARPDHAEAFKDFLEETGIGSHKAALGFFGWLGQSMGEGKVVLGDPNAGQDRKSDAQVMYPNDAGKPGARAGV